MPEPPKKAPADERTKALWPAGPGRPPKPSSSAEAPGQVQSSPSPRGRGRAAAPAQPSPPLLSYVIPPALAPYLRIGTCSWKYASWKGLIYDERKAYRPDEYLADYAQHLNTVEVDQWFWSLFPATVRLPEPHVVRLYAQIVPDDFIFTVKAPNALTLTHFYSKPASGAAAAFAGKPNRHFLSLTLLEAFLDRLAPLGRKLGPVMFQFEYLNRQKMPSAAAFIEQFDAFITRAPKGFQYAVETRNPNYLSPAFFEFLARRGLGFVYLDGYYMPPIGQVFERNRPRTVAAADFQVVRLHGGDRLEIERETGDVWDRVVAPKTDGLRAAARIVRANARKKVLTFVNVNNHYEGSAPMTIGRLLEVLREKDED